MTAMMGDHLFGKAAAIEGWSELCFCLRRGPKMREAEEDGGQEEERLVGVKAA